MGLRSVLQKIVLGEKYEYIQDKVVLANATGSSPDSKPKSVTAKARHAGLVYNPSYSSRYAEEGYTRPEYDLSNIANAIDTESYLRRAIEKYVELMWKSGYRFVGKNQNAVNYVRRRFEQIAKVSSFPTDELLRQISFQLVAYGNTFVSKVRDKDASGGSYRRTFTGALRAPVAAYFVEDSVSMRIAVRDNGDPIGYKQMIPGSRFFKKWKPWNIIHFFYSKKPGIRYGTPLVWPVMDDIRALRKIEENVELLIFQHTVPLYHYKIGTPERPAQDPEITATKNEVEKMPPNGAIVTPERHEITAIGAEKKALDVADYLNYFKQRVFSGLGMSPIGMGESGSTNKGAATVVDTHMHNTTETFQRITKMFIDDFIIKELLAEGGYSFDAIEDDNKVELYFPPVDKEAQYAKENHYTQLYAEHAITEDELRIELGRDMISDEDRDSMYFELVQKPMAIISAVDEPFTKESKAVKAAGTSGNGNTSGVKNKIGGQSKVNINKTIKAGNTGKQRERPVNQSGRALTKPKFPKNDSIIIIDQILNHTLQDVLDSYIDYRDSDDFSTYSIKKTIFDLSKNTIKKELLELQIDYASFGIVRTDRALDELYDKVSKVFNIKNKYDAISKITTMFETSKTRLRTVFNTLESKNACEEKTHSED